MQLHHQCWETKTIHDIDTTSNPIHQQTSNVCIRSVECQWRKVNMLEFNENWWKCYVYNIFWNIMYPHQKYNVYLLKQMVLYTHYGRLKVKQSSIIRYFVHLCVIINIPFIIYSYVKVWPKKNSRELIVWKLSFRDPWYCNEWGFSEISGVPPTKHGSSIRILGLAATLLVWTLISFAVFFKHFLCLKCL